MHNICLRIAGRDVLRDISFSIARGESAALVGPNGAGKSSILKLITRALASNSGQCLLKGKELADYSQRSLACAVAWLPQSYAAIFPHAVREFVQMGRYPRLDAFKTLHADDVRIADSALDLCGISNLAARRLDSLSGGERQLVLLASALAQEPELLLLDEPDTYLDPLYRQRMHAVFQRLRSERGLTLLSATHDLNFACQSPPGGAIVNRLKPI